MKKILVIGTTNLYGGVGHVVFELLRHMKKNPFIFDLMYYEKPTEKEYAELKELGVRFYQIPRYSRKPIAFFRAVKKLYGENHYDVIHIHASTAMLIMYAFPVWRSKDTRIFYHSHLDNLEKRKTKLLHFSFRAIVNRYCCKRIAVSQAAARFMYGKKAAVILKNGFEAEQYAFSEKLRIETRKALNLQDCFVLGHIGRFCYQKNQEFLIEVMEKILPVCQNARMLLIGDGEDLERIRKLSDEKKVADKIIFYGTTEKVVPLLCAMDCFLFPSRYEGLGIVALEAQVNGLSVIASNEVPEEAQITKNFFRLSAESASAEKWVEKIIEVKKSTGMRHSYLRELDEKGYNIEKIALQLKDLYME